MRKPQNEQIVTHATPVGAPSTLGAESRILTMRLQRPRTGLDLLPRTELHKRLDAGLRAGVTLVSAPAGFGKSTLIAAWLQQQTRPTAWLSLEEGIADLDRFLSYVVAAIQTVFPTGCRQAEQLRYAQQPLTPAVMADILIDDLLHLPEPLILTLDDYHLIHTLPTHDFMTHLLRYLPEQMHLVLITRADPPLPLARLRAAGRLVEVRGRDLRFDRDECRTFLQQTLAAPVGESVVDAVVASTEGWPAGLRLAALSIQAHPEAAVTLAGMAQNEFIVDYLMDEVLARQEDDRLNFLLTTSILDQFCAGLCLALLVEERRGSANSTAQPTGAGGPDFAWVQQELATLERSNLFTIALDQERRWYRFHHLFLELLRYRLRERVGAEVVASLHTRAARWYAANGFVEAATRHSILAGDPLMAARIVEANVLEVFNRQESHRVVEWLQPLPAAVVEQRPLLLLMQAWIEHELGHQGQVRELLIRIEGLLAQTDHGLDPFTEQTVRGEVMALWTVLASMAGEHGRVIELADEALRLIPARWQRTRCGLINHKVLAHDALGDRTEALRVIGQVLSVRENEPAQVQVAVLITWGFLALKGGDPAKMVELGQQVLDLAARFNMIQATIFGHYRTGIAHFKRNELAEARQHFQRCLDLRHIAYYRIIQESLAALALMDPAGAASHLQDILTFDLAVAGEQAALFGASIEARIALLQDNIPRVRAWLHTYQPPPTTSMEEMIEMAPLTYVRALLATGATDALSKGLVRLEALRTQAETERFLCHLPDILAVEALALDCLGRSADALASLARAVEVAQPGGLIRLFVELGTPMARLLQRLASTGHKGAQWLLQKLDRTPPAAATVAVVVAPQPAELVEPLTNRELDVLQLLDARLSDKEIAAQLHISVTTVQQHNKNIYQKLQVSKRRQAVERARSLGLLPAAG
jgi:LuxR family maltose regulon positive regulatory protein